jgi:protein-S-isoprenylcysteine O-methyltransferase Ste14
LIIGLVVSIYWVRVMVMVRQTRKRAGHGANLVPPEPLGRLLRLIWGPVTILWILLPYVAFIAKKAKRFPKGWRPYLGTFQIHWVFGYVAALLAVLSLWATMVCWRRMGRSWRMGIDPNDKTQLVCNGPYAYVRHPIYGLSTLLMLATTVAVPNPLMLGAGVIHLVLLQWEARREERHLLRIHGEEYAQYMKGTGRFFPKTFKPYGVATRGFDAVVRKPQDESGPSGRP